MQAWLSFALVLTALRIEIVTAELQYDPWQEDTQLDSIKTSDNVDRLRSRTPLNGRRQSLLKPQVNFATDFANKDKVWMLLPWKLDKEVAFPKPQDDTSEHYLKSNRATDYTKKIFLAPYPRKIQGGELYGFANAERACRESGQAFHADGGFRALLTTHNRPLSKILPKHMYNLSVVNIEGDLLAETWGDFIDGKITDHPLIAMDGTKDHIGPRWSWKYFWLGDGYGRTCEHWLSSYFMDVANVFAFDYQSGQVVNEISSCSASLHLLCYSVCDEYGSFL
uniref:Endostatin domain-containing protein n=1 Tax=Mesocestoides corti TaxID=53468 RepID=A0A5K3FBG0_MESCO